jgi:gliding motility-associated-like protein
MKLYYSLLLLFFSCLQAFSQCTSTISSFPYNQNFEAGMAGWQSGGIATSWEFGTPAKAIINVAASGTKCFISGGLAMTSYNSNERSYVTSPCFNFTSVTNPYISMKLYWETENNYDGTTFQYSINNGTTWTNVGSASDPANCLNQNWFNTANITYLTTLATPKEGWSGSTTSAGTCPSANGSGGWVTAKHCMSYLAGLPSVQFRFAFGAGSICNTYDGFAFDDIFIGEAPPNQANFTSACTGNVLEYNFTNTSTPCPSGFTWNFGDPGSGASNTSLNQNPTHVFSSPGTYVVSLTVLGPCNGSSTITHSIVTINATATATPPACANGTNGTITVGVTNSTTANTFTIQPSGSTNTSGLFTNITANSYTVTVTNSNNCAASTAIAIINPASIAWSSTFATQNITCNGLQNGSISALAIGGIGTLNYTLSPGGANNQTGIFTGLNLGQFTITVSDANGCSISSLVQIQQPNPLSLQTPLVLNEKCFGQHDGSITCMANGGSGTLQFKLLPLGTINNTGSFTNLNAGNYTVQISDANNCSISTTLSVVSANQIIINPITTIEPWCNPNNNGSINVTANGGSGNIAYSLNGNLYSSTGNFNNLNAQQYIITVKDASNCTLTNTVTLNAPPTPVINSVNMAAVNCYGDANGKIDVIASSSSNIVSYSLLPANTTLPGGNFSGLSAGNYTITVTDQLGCTVSSVTSVQSPAVLVIDEVKNETSDSCGETFKATMKIIPSGGTPLYTFRIIPGAIENTTGIFTNLKATDYSVLVKDANGCSVQVNVLVKEQICCGNVVAPNAFSPNGDDKNDEFHLLNTEGIEVNEFVVYNRYGGIVFKSKNPYDAWDGKYKGETSDLGTYYYQVKYKCLLSNKTYVLKGDINLIR